MCKPAFKPMRCPVCVRWFGTVEGLQKHLVAHNDPSSFPCEFCTRTYLTLKSLKDHKRKVHRSEMIKAALPPAALPDAAVPDDAVPDDAVPAATVPEMAQITIKTEKEDIDID